MANSSLTLWTPEEQTVVPKGASDPVALVPYATQISQRDQKQILQAFQAEHYEMAVSYVWGKAMSTLKRDLSTVGVRFLGEMLGKPLTETDVVAESITDKEAIRLAEELGVVNPTEAMRLRHIHELVTHFSQLSPGAADSDAVEMDGPEAIQALKTCVVNILSRPRVDVATEFTQFRKELEERQFHDEDPSIRSLIRSPYFFKKLTVAVLLSAIKQGDGARLDHATANLGVILPALWKGLRESEKWQVGVAYAEVHAAGKTTAMAGIQAVMLKVSGFDYVPENLRSTTYIKQAEKLITAHEGLNNFYNEPTPMQVLASLGTSIPLPALPMTMSAALAVRMGNSYGRSWAAQPDAKRLLRGISTDKWAYYLNECLPSDIRIINKLMSASTRKNWFEVAADCSFEGIEVKDSTVKKLLAASIDKNDDRLDREAQALRNLYYGKK